MRSTLCIIFLLVCASVNAQTTVITKGAIPMGIEVYDYQNERQLDISKLCRGFDDDGVPENLIIPYKSQIRIFFPNITAENAADYVLYADSERRLRLSEYNLEFEYQGSLVSNPINQSSSAGSFESIGLVYMPNIVDPSNFTKNIRLDWQVDYEPIELELFIQNDEIDERQIYSDSIMNNLFSSSKIRKSYDYWLKNGYAQNLNADGLPENPVIPRGSGMISFASNAPDVSLYRNGEKIEFDRFEQRPYGSNAIYYFKPDKSGNYTLLMTDSRKVYGETTRSYSFSVPFNFWQEGGYYLLGGIGLLGIFFLVYRIDAKRKLERAKLNSQISSAELKAIRSQLNPHFLFNALNAIQNLVNQQKNEQANEYIVKLSRLMRQVLSQSNENFHSLEEELDLNKLYIELEQLRKPFEFELNLPASIDGNTLVPNMILQPYLENAVLHGVHHNGADRVSLEIKEKQGSLLIRISNNGKQASSSFNEGQGMKLGKQRLEIVNQQFEKDSASINTQIGIEHFIVELKLPKNL